MAEISESAVKISSPGTLLRYDSTYSFSGHERTRIRQRNGTKAGAGEIYERLVRTVSPRTRACMLRAYYAKSGSCRKGVSLLRESRYGTHAP